MQPPAGRGRQQVLGAVTPRTSGSAATASTFRLSTPIPASDPTLNRARQVASRWPSSTKAAWSNAGTRAASGPRQQASRQAEQEPDLGVGCFAVLGDFERHGVLMAIDEQQADAAEVVTQRPGCCRAVSCSHRRTLASVRLGRILRIWDPARSRLSVGMDDLSTTAALSDGVARQRDGQSGVSQVDRLRLCRGAERTLRPVTLVGHSACEWVGRRAVDGGVQCTQSAQVCQGSQPVRRRARR